MGKWVNGALCLFYPPQSIYDGLNISSRTYKCPYKHSPCLFGVIMYPLAGLQMNTSRFLKFLGILIVESYAAAGFGMVRRWSYRLDMPQHSDRTKF